MVLNNWTLANLITPLQNKSWDSVFNASDPNCVYDLLISEISDSINKTIPEKTIKQNTKYAKPWITKGILKSINTKNKLYKNYI